MLSTKCQVASAIPAGSYCEAVNGLRCANTTHVCNCFIISLAADLFQLKKKLFIVLLQEIVKSCIFKKYLMIRRFIKDTVSAFQAYSLHNIVKILLYSFHCYKDCILSSLSPIRMHKDEVQKQYLPEFLPGRSVLR